MKSGETRGRWKTARKSQKPAGGTRDRRTSSCPRIGRSISPCSPLAPAKVSQPLCITAQKERVVIENKYFKKKREIERGDNINNKTNENVPSFILPRQYKYKSLNTVN